MPDPLRLLADAKPRVETGPTRFGDDWPGIFIRGDDALGLAAALRAAGLRGYYVSLLESCAVPEPDDHGRT